MGAATVRRHGPHSSPGWESREALAKPPGKVINNGGNPMTERRGSSICTSPKGEQLKGWESRAALAMSPNARPAKGWSSSIPRFRLAG